MRFTIAAFLLCVTPGSLHGAPAIPAGLEANQFSQRVWLKRDGLPHNTVTALAQTRDGYLWIGTLRGLARFDGVLFRSFTLRTSPELGAPYVYSLLPLRDGSLVIGTAAGGFSRLRGDKITRIPAPPEVEAAVALQLYEDRAGGIWAATTGGLAYIEGDSVKRVYDERDGLPSLLVRSVAEDREGALYLSAGSQVLVRKDSVFRVLLPEAVLKAPPGRLAFDQDGALWIGTYGHGVMRYRNGVVRRFGQADGLSSNETPLVLAAARGGVWVGTPGGTVDRIRSDRVSAFAPPGSHETHETLVLFEDREENLWRGLANGGLFRFARSTCVSYRLGGAGGASEATVLFEGPHGALIATGGIAETFFLDQDTFVPARVLPPGVKALIHSSMIDSRGAMWLATSGGMYRLSGGRWERYDVGLTTAVAEDGAGRVWAGTEAGLRLLQGGSVRECSGLDSVCGGQIRFLLADRNDNLWIGTQDAGLARMRLPDTLRPGDRFCRMGIQWYRVDSGLPSNWITSVLEDDSSGVWVGTMGGLARVDGDRIRAYGAESGMPADAAYMVLPDGTGNLWISTNNGIVRAPKADLRRSGGARNGIVTASVYGVLDGMSTDECTGGFASSGIRTRDGRLWFPTTDGVVMINPAGLPVNPVPPSVVIEQVIVDGRVIQAGENFQIPPGRGELEIHYTGISLASPERVRYRTRLDGYDSRWVDAGGRRAAYYTNLPPGRYRFNVAAASGDGVWNEEGAAVTLTLQPHFTETIWFYFLIGLLVMLAGAGVHALYRRDRERQLTAAQLESKLTRAQLRILEMQMQPHFLFNALNGIMVLIREDPGRAARMIARLSDFLRSGLQRADMREVPLRNELEVVDSYLEIELLRFGDRLTVDRHVDEEVLEALIPPMILQPLVENAIRHGVAQRRGPVTLEIVARRRNGFLDIRVRDDGAGLKSPPEALREHIGLGNTRSRLEQLYGRSHILSVEPRPGGGVEVTLQVPYHIPAVEEIK